VTTRKDQLRLFFYLLLSACAISSFCQQAKSPNYILLSDIRYVADDTLKADFYLPLEYKQQKNPVLIFVSAGDFRKADNYLNWAKFVAARGITGVLYQSTREQADKNLDQLLEFLSGNSAKYFIDAQQFALYAASGIVHTGLPFANKDPRIKTALIFYGVADIAEFRIDLPVLMVRSGLDNNGLNKNLDTLVFRAMQANAPYTVFNFNSAVHGFEADSDPVVQSIMEESVDFLKVNMGRSVRERFSQKQNEIIAMRELYRGNWNGAVIAFREALQKNPDDNETERQMGNAYIELKDYEHAIEAFNSSLAHGNWRRGEIAAKKCTAYAALQNNEAAVDEMRILRKIGWFDEKAYASNTLFRNLVNSEPYKKFLNEK